MGLFENKEWKSTKDIRPATNDERALFMKYCPTAKESQEVYVTRGTITKVITTRFASSEASGAALGISMAGVGSTMGGAMQLLKFKIDFHNGYENIISGQCVLYTRDRDLNVEVVSGTECKLMWIKKRHGYEFRFAIPEGVTENTPITWCRMCSKEMRTKDLREDGLCIYCHKPVDASFSDFLKS